MNKRTRLLLFSLIVISNNVIITGAPTGMKAVMTYLANYGYMDKSEMEKQEMNMTMMKNSLQKMQEYFKLDSTGNIDKPTMDMISHPRCGMPDMNEFSRTKRYSVAIPYNKTVLTYKIMNHPDYLALTDIEREIRIAFSLWANEVEDLTFRRTDGHADLRIGFYSGDHGDSYSFDNEGNVLAHAFRPPYGDIHFSTTTTWTMDKKDGTNFLQAATHEIGHSLGMFHSNVGQNVVMYPMYMNYSSTFQLHDDDVKGIRELYNKPKE